LLQLQCHNAMVFCLWLYDLQCFWTQEEESDEEDEEGGDDVDVSTLAFSEDSMLTSNYREMTTHVKSSRVDAVVSAGLGLPRKYVATAIVCI